MPCFISRSAGAISLVCQGSVAIVMSENEFYAVPSIAGKVSREMETNSFGGDVVEPMMIVNFNTLS